MPFIVAEQQWLKVDRKKRVITIHVYWLGGWVNRKYSIRVTLNKTNLSGQTQNTIINHFSLITCRCRFSWNDIMFQDTLSCHGRHLKAGARSDHRSFWHTCEDAVAGFRWPTCTFRGRFRSLLFGYYFLGFLQNVTCVILAHVRQNEQLPAIFISPFIPIPCRCRIT